ncbi:MAG: hypothetical protein JWQ19_1079 [Subtercola sp.]|nr:hypothetical protein [Subtercola sp.]
MHSRAVGTFAQMRALDRAITPIRLSTYVSAAGGDIEHARALYVWDRNLSAALLRDVAILEVALRNTMNAQLVALHGPNWYESEIGLDNRSRQALGQAWDRLVPTKRTSGHLVSQLMFGFWRNLLESGGYIGRLPMRYSVNYEGLWRTALALAFPGGRHEARQSGDQFTRSWTLGVVAVVHATRNRAAHHEPLVNGFPLPGQQQRAGGRISSSQAHAQCLRLARMIDRDLAEWMESDSAVPGILKAKP